MFSTPLVLDKRITLVLRLVVVKTLTAVRIKDRDLKELEKLAKKEDETVSFFIRQAIKEFLDRRRKQ
jgi:Ribbon-helix-helix protein, copG family